MTVLYLQGDIYMRVRRMALIFLVFYLVFIGGSAYYTLVFPVRLFHHALMTLLVVLWFWGRLRLGRGLPRTPLDVPILAAIVVSVISAIFSLDSRMAFENLWFAFIHLVLFYVLIDLFQRGRHRMVMETQFILSALIVFVTGLEVASWYFGLGIVPGTDIGWIDVVGPGAWLPLELPRVSLAMNISTLLAGYVAPLVPLVVGWSLTARQPEFRRVLRWLALLLVVVLLLTFSRGGMLSLVASLTVFAVLQISRSRRFGQLVSRRVLLPGLGLVIIIGAAVFMLVSLSGSRSSGDQVRLDMYRSAIDIAADYPIFGVGPGIYGRVLRDYRSPELSRDRLASAHNLYLNTLSEVGIAGVLVSVWLLWAFSRAVMHTWRSESGDGARIRIEAAVAALIGVGVHSLVDVFTTTPLVLLILLLAAFALVGTRSVLEPTPPGRRWPCVLGLIVAISYGVWFLQIDRAQVNYQFSLVRVGTDEAIDLARSAAEIDPYLNLYDLHIAYLLGEGLDQDSAPAMIATAITAYEYALSLEPTWDVGWMNLAALETWRGNDDRALTYVERAYAINPGMQANWNWPRVQEIAESGDQSVLRSQYVDAQRTIATIRRYLPLSDVWQETGLRRAAVQDFLVGQRVDLQYRILSRIDPEAARSLVEPAPSTAAEWWVAGENALQMGDAVTAVAYFDEAIALSPRNGDYYTSRARAQLQTDPEAALRDLDFAYLLVTRYEQPLAVRAELVDDADEARLFRARALYPRILRQEFAAVLYGGRMAMFDLYPAMRYPGPGREMMQPWYTVADDYVAVGDVEAARQVYEAILDYAPDETEASEQLRNLP